MGSGTRWLGQVVLSDDDNEAAADVDLTNQRQMKKLKLAVGEEEDDDGGGQLGPVAAEPLSVAAPTSSDDEEEAVEEDPHPIDHVVRVSGKGPGRRRHFASFGYDGIRYNLEDPVFLVPDEPTQKPDMAIIKDISQTKDGNVMITGQKFYRPGEAEKKGGGVWQSSSTRELFYSFQQDEFPAECVMHKFVVHFIPPEKQIPPRTEHPGFIVQRIYYTEQKRLVKLKDAGANKEDEIDLLVQKTISRLGDLPDIEPEAATAP